MTTYNVSIPDNKDSFFREFLELIGAKYEKKQDTFELSDEQKMILDNQDDFLLSDYEDNESFVAELKKEYGV